MKFIGTHTAREVSLCKLDPDNGDHGGANPHAHVLIRKSKDSPTGDDEKNPPNPLPKDDIMSLKNLQRVASMSDVTKSYFVALDETQGTAFLEKSAEAQDAEAAEAKKVADDKAAAEAAKAAGKTQNEADLEKRLAASDARTAELEKRLNDQNQDAQIAKAAAHKDFDGFPGGTDAVIAKMKAVAGQSEEVRKAVEDGLRAQASLAKTLAPRVGVVLSSVDMEKSAPATHRVTEAAKTRAKANNTTEAAEIYKMSKEPAWRADYDAMQQEASAAAA